MTVRLRNVTALLATSALLFAAVPESSATPTAPAPGAATAAQDAARAAAQHVTRTEAQVGIAAARVRTAQGTAAAAQQGLAAQLTIQRSASAAASRAVAHAQETRQASERAHREFVIMVTADYQSGSEGTTTIGALLTATNPDELLAAGQRSDMITAHRAVVVDNAKAAAEADAAAQQQRLVALRRATAASDELRARVQTSTSAVRASTQALGTLRRELGEAKVTQAQTDAVLSSFLGGWSVADPHKARGLNARYLKLADGQRQQSMPRGKGWTAQKGQAAAWRALAWIGTPYAWAGGSASGPTVGVCAGDGAQNDCHLSGFDCSGLVLNGWAPYLSLPHLASSQYRVAGRNHPGIDALKAGDLVFWSSDGTVAGIHHVAMYVGKGYVVQAPQSGDIVRVTPLAAVASGYYGATRPQS